MIHIHDKINSKSNNKNEGKNNFTLYLKISSLNIKAACQYFYFILNILLPQIFSLRQSSYRFSKRTGDA